MGFSSWFYGGSTSNSTKKKVVKIVHPGGHAELHDKPILASEVIRRNPRCCVTHPNVFHQPWAIVSPETTLMPGQKFYVVPINTIRKLQQLSLKQHPNSVVEDGEKNGMVSSCCWLFVDKISMKSAKDGYLVNGCCFTCFIIKTNTKTKNKSIDEDSSKEARSSSSCGFSEANATGNELHHWHPNLEIINEESIE